MPAENTTTTGQPAYPMDYTSRSISSPICLGVLQDGQADPTPAGAHISNNLIALGYTGSGTSDLIRTIIGSTLLCRDALVMAVCTDYGLIATPWLAANPQRPVLERVGIDVATTASTLRHCMDIVEHRSQTMHKILARHDVARMPTSTGRERCTTCDMVHPPQIVVVADQTVAGKFDDSLTWLTRAGRPWGVSVVAAYERATADTMPRAMTLSFDTRVVFRSDPNDMAYLIGPRKNLPDPQTFRHGEALLHGIDGVLDRMDTYTVSRDQIVEIVDVASDSPRPQLSAKEQELGGEEYSGRWLSGPVRQLLVSLSA